MDVIQSKLDTSSDLFQKNFNADSSLIAGLLLIEYVSKKNQSFSKLVSQYDRYFESGEINFRVKDIDLVIKKIEKNVNWNMVMYRIISYISCDIIPSI